MKIVRPYLILLFVAVAGVGSYMFLWQYNLDSDLNSSYNGENFKETPAPSTPTPSPSPAISDPISVETESKELANLLSDVSESDFDTSSLDDSALGL